MREMWDRAGAGDREARNTLVTNFLPLVRYVAGQMRVSLPRHVDIEDLISYGHIGLIGAVDRFDPDRGVHFTTFAVQRIRGSILDELRAQDWAPRRVRRTGRELERAASALNARLQRDPTLEELADELGVDADGLHAMLSEVSMAGPHLSTDVEMGQNEDAPLTLGDLIPSEASIEEMAVEGDHAHRIASAISMLEAQERTLVALYYFEDCTFSQIASLLGVTESRVFQVHASAMRSLRSLATA